MRDKVRQRETSRRADKIRRVEEHAVMLFHKQDETPTFLAISRKLGLSEKTVMRAYKTGLRKLQVGMSYSVNKA